MMGRKRWQVGFGSVVMATAVAGCGAASGELDAEAVGDVSQAVTTYQVGPGRPYATLQAVAGLLKPGDVVQVDGGATYAGGVRFTKSGSASNKIKLVGVAVKGKRPVLSGGTNTVEFAADHY